MNKQFKVLTLIAAMGFCGAANAVSCGDMTWTAVDINYYAKVWGHSFVNNAATMLEFSDAEQTSAGGSCAGRDAFSEAGAVFGGVPLVHAQAASFNGLGQGDAHAFLFDTLTFHIAGGGSADVLAQMSGNWTATDGSYLHYYFNSGSVAVIDHFWYASGLSGSYVDGGLFHVEDNASYRMYVGVGTVAPWGSGSAYIDDPLTFQLPSGVTFTSASGSTYVSAVPLPAAAWLFGSGLLGLIGVARRKARAAGQGIDV